MFLWRVVVLELDSHPDHIKVKKDIPIGQFYDENLGQHIQNQLV